MKYTKKDIDSIKENALKRMEELNEEDAELFLWATCAVVNKIEQSFLPMVNLVEAEDHTIEELYEMLKTLKSTNKVENPEIFYCMNFENCKSIKEIDKMLKENSKTQKDNELIP